MKGRERLLVFSVAEFNRSTGYRKATAASGTSVGAHYREAVRSRSNAEFVNKIEGGLQELEETGYWIELLIESGILKRNTALQLTFRGP